MLTYASKHTEKEKEKLAIEVRAFIDEQGKILAGQVFKRLEYR
jgi:hypothetical protein